MTSTIEAYGRTFRLRGGAGDEFVVKENSYRAVFARPVDPKSVWLDVGAHIGTFTCRIAPLVAQVIAVEPSLESLRLLRNNIALNKITNVEVVDAAVVASELAGFETTLAVSERNAGNTRVGTVRGREHELVPTTSIGELIDDYSPNRLKIDCEGGEAAIFDDLFEDLGESLRGVDEIIFEWHFAILKDTAWGRLDRVRDALRRAGFTIDGPTTVSKRWTAVFHAYRE